MAFRIVKDTLESELGNDEYSSNAWFDWFVTGGGRWNSNPDSQYNDDDQSMTISYAEEPDRFISEVNRAISNRIVEFNGYRKNFESKNVSLSDSLDKYDGQMDFSFDLYDLGKCIDMLQGKWDFNSYFYDMHHATTNTKYMLDNLDDSWYLIFVDFHF